MVYRIRSFPGSPARGLAALALASLLGACSPSADEARARHDAMQKPAAAQGEPQPAGPDTLDMVSAVSTADALPPVHLKFRLHDAPHVGQPLQLELALIQEPKLAIEAMRVSIQPREGLQLKSPSAIDFPSPAVGATQIIPVALEPQQQGVLGLLVTVLVNTERDSLSRSFAIPLVVVAGDGAAAAVADAVPAPAKAKAKASATPR
jgi:hypothetical protein